MSFRVAYGNTHTENGWRCVNRDGCDIVRIPGLFMTETAPLRTGPPLTILGAWLFWYDRNVEEILTSIWGWSATNDVPGQPGRNNGSNHLSGTAVDVNAPRYPWGRRVMPADRIAKIREGLRLFEGSVFWGADWNRADEMHYQMSWPEGDPRNDAFARKLLDGHLGIYKQVGTAPAPTTDDRAVALLSQAMGGSQTLNRYRALLPAVSDALNRCGCNTVDRRAMWFAQIGHESAGLRYMEEIASGAAYEGRRDLGNTQPGDGVRFKGRGPIQVTGRHNYTELSQWAFGQGLVPSPTFFVDQPAQLASDRYGFLGVVWYWTVARPDINTLSDKRDLDTVTRRINGGLNGIADRRERYNRALAMGSALLDIKSGGTDDMAQVPQDEWNRVRDEVLRRHTSGSLYATPGEREIGTTGTLVRNTDAMSHEDLVERLAVLGDHDALARVLRVYNGQGARSGTADRARAAAVLAKVPTEILQGFIDAQKGK